MRKSPRARVVDAVAVGGAVATGIVAVISLILSTGGAEGSALVASVGASVGLLLGIVSSFLATRVSRSGAELEMVRAALQGLILQASAGLQIAASQIAVDVYLMERPLFGKPRLVKVFHEQLGSFESLVYPKHLDVAERVVRQRVLVSVSGGDSDELSGPSGSPSRVLGIPIFEPSSDKVFGVMLLTTPARASSTPAGDGDAVLHSATETSQLLGYALSRS